MEKEKLRQSRRETFVRLMEALMRRDGQAVEALVRAGTSLEDTLTVTLVQANREELEFLLDHGVDVNYENRRRENLLAQVLYFCLSPALLSGGTMYQGKQQAWEAIISLLIERGADCDSALRLLGQQIDKKAFATRERSYEPLLQSDVSEVEMRQLYNNLVGLVESKRSER
jgi:Trp operon repressor